MKNHRVQNKRKNGNKTTKLANNPPDNTETVDKTRFVLSGQAHLAYLVSQIVLKTEQPGINTLDDS